jgi:hypothetical protein
VGASMMMMMSSINLIGRLSLLSIHLSVAIVKLEAASCSNYRVWSNLVTGWNPVCHATVWRMVFTIEECSLNCASHRLNSENFSEECLNFDTANPFQPSDHQISEKAHTRRLSSSQVRTHKRSNVCSCTLL